MDKLDLIVLQKVLTKAFRETRPEPEESLEYGQYKSTVSAAIYAMYKNGFLNTDPGTYDQFLMDCGAHEGWDEP